jgi:membrane associated rhomboid family serine protease
MFENRGYPRQRWAFLESPATFGLLAVNICVYVVQYHWLSQYSEARFEDRFALSLDGLRAGHIWQLLSYQFLHAGWFHILVNSWAIFVFGRVVEQTLGWRRMLGLYFLSGVMGGLLQMAGSWLWPALFGDPSVVGASAGAFGLVAAFAALFPRQQLLMLLFFVIPVAMRARTLLGLSIVLAVFGIAYPALRPLLHRYTSPAVRNDVLDPLFLNIGHAAHLGGLLTGFVCALVLKRDFEPQTYPSP